MDWEDVKAFVAVAQTGTVRRAAARLGVHHATIGRRVARLEGVTQARLFDRRPEGLALTGAGEDLLAVSSRMADQLDAAARRISGVDTAPRGSVIATMGAPVAAQLIAPGLPGFAARFPGLDLRINATWSIRDLARGEADIAIRADNNPSDTLVGKRLFAYAETVYASRSYLARHRDGGPGRWIGWGGSGAARPQWIERSEFAGAEIWGGFPDQSVQTAAAEAGLGLICLPCFIGDRVPGLERASDTAPRPARDIWLLTHPDLRRTKRIRIAMEFLEERMRLNRALLQGEEPRRA